MLETKMSIPCRGEPGHVHCGRRAELNRALNMGEDEYYTIPETRQAVAQELLLFTLQAERASIRW